MPGRVKVGLWVVASWWLAGCAWLTGNPGPWLESLPPLPLVDSTAAGQISGVLTFQQGEQSLEFPLALLVSGERMAVVVLSPIGGALTSAVLVSDQLEATGGGMLPPPLRGGTLLRALQLALWPLASTQSALAAADWEVNEVGPLREIRYRGVPQIQIRSAYPDPTQGRVEFDHLNERYHWTLRILQTQALDAPAP